MKIKTFLPRVKSVRAEKGIATLSSSRLLPGQYRVRVNSRAKDGASAVKLKITSIQKLSSGKSGKFSHRYDTESTPSKILKIKNRYKEKQVTSKPGINEPFPQSSTSSDPNICPKYTETLRTEVLTVASNRENGEIYTAQSPPDEGNSFLVTV